MTTRNLAAAALLGWVGLALGAPAGAQDILGACAEDIAAYCEQVEPGNGRMLACLYAHEQSISDDCDRAVGDMADVLDAFFARVRNALEQCAPDIRTHCADVAIGDGRVYQCLAARPDLTAACREVVDTISPPEG